MDVNDSDLMQEVINNDSSDDEARQYGRNKPQRDKEAIDDKDLKHILKLKPETRSSEQIGILKNHVKDIKVFKDFNQQSTEDQLHELCRNLHLQFLPESKVLFEQGDRGDSFFIILEGMVDIMVKTVDEKNGMEFNKKVAALKKGDSFGDLSLLYGAPRNATVKTKEDSYFIVMSKGIFDKIIKSHQVDKIHEIAQYYLNFPLFQNLDKITLMYFATKTITQKLQSKQVIVKQGDDTGRVYFVRSGRLKIIKKVYFRRLPENGYLTFEELIDDPLLTEVRKGFFDLRLLQLDIVEQGDVFCHHSVINHTPLDYTVITEVPCEVFIINEMDFLTLSKEILDDFEDYIKPYPKDRELRKMYYESIRWKNYKSNVIDLIKQSKALQFSSLLRGAQITKAKALDQEYLQMNEKTIVYHKNFKNQKQQFNTYKKSSSRQSRDQSPSTLSPQDTGKVKQKRMNNAVFTIKEEPEQTTMTGGNDTNTGKLNVQALLKRKLSLNGGYNTSRLALPRSIKLDRLERTERGQLGVSTFRQSLAGGALDFSQTATKETILPSNVQVERKRNKTIYQFESKTHDIKLIYNQSKVAACGVLPPVQIKIRNMQTANYQQSQAQAYDEATLGLQNEQTMSKKRKASQISGYQDTYLYQTQRKRLRMESGYYVKPSEEEDSTVESRRFLSQSKCSPFDLDQIQEEAEGNDYQEEEDEIEELKEEKERGPLVIQSYYELFKYEEYIGTMKKILQIQLDSCPIREQPRQLQKHSCLGQRDRYKENSIKNHDYPTSSSSLKGRLEFFNQSCLYDQIEDGMRNMEINERVASQIEQRVPLKDLTSVTLNRPNRQVSMTRPSKKSRHQGCRPTLDLRTEKAKHSYLDSGLEYPMVVEQPLKSVKAIYLR